MKILFVGNRRFVLEEILKKKINCKVLVIKGSHLEKDLSNMNVDNYQLINSKIDLLNEINKVDFDFFLSNGCPYIIPNKYLNKKKYINIHPSFLPDLKGIDPIIGSVKFQRDSGATCHLITKDIDGGPIISQEKIKFSKDLDSTLLYQLSFIAEKKVFNDGLKLNFVPQKKQKKGNWIYYSRKDNDRFINFQNTCEEIIQNVKAFSNKSQGCYFFINNAKFRFYYATILKVDYLKKYSKKFNDLEVIIAIEDMIIFKLFNKLIKFSGVIGVMSQVKIGDKISGLKF